MPTFGFKIEFCAHATPIATPDPIAMTAPVTSAARYARLSFPSFLMKASPSGTESVPQLLCRADPAPSDLSLVRKRTANPARTDSDLGEFEQEPYQSRRARSSSEDECDIK